MTNAIELSRGSSRTMAEAKPRATAMARTRTKATIIAV
jgi:hypothetical protein